MYIAPDDYAKAAQNGVTAATLEQRVRVYGWSLRRAVLTPPKTVDKHLVVAEKNGISVATYRKRVYKLRWSREKASTTPVKKPPGQDWCGVAEMNGISKNTFYQRIGRYGWSPEKAATTPILPPAKRRILASASTGQYEKMNMEELNREL